MPRKITLDLDDIRKAYETGESVLSMSKRIGVSRKVISDNLIRIGLTPRGSSEAIKLVWQSMPADQRKKQVEAAHAATINLVMGFDELCKSAAGRERTLSAVSEQEIEFSEFLKQLGISFSQQTAVGPYNCDFTIDSVAVEIFGGGWHWYGNHVNKVDKRFRYILNSGFHILAISDYGGIPITIESARYLKSFLQFTGSNPSMTREYRVIRGAGDLIACGSMYDNEISIKPSFTTGRDADGRYVRIPRKAPTM